MNGRLALWASRKAPFAVLTGVYALTFSTPAFQGRDYPSHLLPT